MIDWTDPGHVGALIGIVGGSFGGLAGVWGACLGVFAPRGLHRGPIIASGYALLGVATLGVLAGFVLLQRKEALGMLWLPTILVSLNMMFLSGFFTVIAKKRYAMAEERLMSAESLRRE